MKIPPHWIRRKQRIADMEHSLCGFSFDSDEDARRRLEKKADLLAAFHARAAGRAVSRAAVEELRRELRVLDASPGEDTYSVAITEPVLRTLDNANIITRNRYGAQVLNSADTCFLDVDSFPPSFWERICGIFGSSVSEEQRLLRVVHALCAREDGLGIRVYRTARGWRLIVAASGLFAPDSVQARMLYDRLHVDPMYARLCCKQMCWRARLTPKPYRLGMTGRYPAPSDSQAAQNPETAEWVARYDRHCSKAAVCRLIESVGVPMKSEIVELHDDVTRALRPDERLL